MVRKSRHGKKGPKLSAKRKGGGSYSSVSVSFNELKEFPKGVIADRGMFYVVGVARLRQLRVKNGKR